MEKKLEESGITILSPEKYEEIYKTAPAQGKIIFIFMFLPWCRHCQAQLHNIIEFSKAVNESPKLKSQILQTAFNGDTYGRYIYFTFGIELYPTVLIIDTNKKFHFLSPPFNKENLISQIESIQQQS